MIKLINFISFQLVWFACIIGAAYHYELPAIIFGVVCIGLNVYFGQQAQKDAKLIVQGVLIGIVIDTFLIQSGLMTLKTDYWTQISPVWMWIVWAGLMSTVNVSMSWMKQNLVIASVLGAIFAPFSYWAGVRLGAGSFDHLLLSLIAIGILWALITPVIIKLSRS